MNEISLHRFSMAPARSEPRRTSWILAVIVCSVHGLLLWQMAHIQTAPVIEPPKVLSVSLIAPTIAASAPSATQPSAVKERHKPLARKLQTKAQPAGKLAPMIPVSPHRVTELAAVTPNPEPAIKPQPRLKTEKQSQAIPPDRRAMRTTEANFRAQTKSGEATALSRRAGPSRPTQAADAASAESEIPANFRAAYLHNPPPVYPRQSREQEEEGTVRLRVQVSMDGSALQVELVQSSGFPLLDQSAKEAVARWRFVPAKKGGNPVEAWVNVPVTFKLEE